MRLPRDLSGEDLSTRLAALGYGITRQTGSHLRLTTDRDGEHSLRADHFAGVGETGVDVIDLREQKPPHRCLRLQGPPLARRG